MRLWVTGKNGLVGSRLVRHASVATGREVDIADEDAVLSVLKRERPTHIINCAAYTAVDRAEIERERARRANWAGPAILARLSYEYDLPFVHISTDYVFDGSKGAPYTEDDPCTPLNVYGETKLAGEWAVLKAHPRACVVRTSWVFGKGGKNLLSQLPKLLEQDLSVVGDQISRLTYVDDLAAALLQLLNHSGIVHFANGGAATRYEVAQELKRRMQMSCEITSVTLDSVQLPAKRPLQSELATEKVEQLLGKKPREWQETLEDFLA